MSRPSSSAAARNLTLTEELEKLEQSITLTLQEIDHNFSRAHRIVTGSILPIVEQYAKHSEAVWEGSKFWKQFFEASANVSLSGYEEPTGDDATQQDETAVDQTTSAYDDTMAGDAAITRAGAEKTSKYDDEELDGTSILSSPTLANAHSTPRQPSTRQAVSASFAEYTSPYQALKREMHGDTGNDVKTEQQFSSEDEEDPTEALAPTTPGPARREALPDMSMTPGSSPFNLDTQTQQYKDPLLHRMLDRTYRIAATPHTARKQAAAKTGTTPGTASRQRPRRDFDSSPMSSPDDAAPQLRAEIFSSPMKTPRTPGVSVLHTPGAKKTLGATPSGKLDFGTATRFAGGSVAWESDSDDEADFSPPKTMQFHVPQSRLLQTPAQEASKRIVDDLLRTAGGGDLTDELTEDSPSVVRRNQELDDSF
ncbi:hypothetical protein K490DRAFT_63721 [Saccharata proteae CBS 121410]|uniref:DASH complex subunit ASK1 n=1 Tax=Saccharata proteae CBS 121410 TaxID=1314787 RepID=A0A6A5YFJ0_9PEZI|nr:hypothetical protein K490DRAFT_63721 [Saccharata proteae CBS 121410]